MLEAINDQVHRYSPLMLIPSLVLATALNTPPSDCNVTSKDPIVTIETPGSAFQALPSADGCWIFASIPARQSGDTSVIALYKRSKGTLALVRTLEVQGGPTGMALTHDGKTLIVADGDRVAFIDTDRLIHEREGAVLGYLVDSAAKGRVYANVTADDKFAFIADENSKTVSVIDMARARSRHYDISATVGKIPTGTLPIALTFSRDGKFIYITSQWAPPEYGWPIECKRETNNPNNDTTSVNPQGAIHVVDVARAKKDPAHSIVSNVRAGCSAVRFVLSPSGRRAYVTARNSNMLLAFDVAKLRSDTGHARVGSVPVGPAPVGIAVVDGGREIIATNSNRFVGGPNDQQTLTVIDANKVAAGEKAIIGSIPAGAFPREMRVTSDGRTLILTNFGSKSIQMVDLARIPTSTREWSAQKTVGYRVNGIPDSSRHYVGTDSVIARPLHLMVWYPSPQLGGRRLRLRDYLRTPGFPDDQGSGAAVQRYRESLERESGARVDSAAFARLLALPTAAVRNAQPPIHRRPTLLLEGGLTTPAYLYSALAERLAERGFVVAAIPSFGHRIGVPLSFDTMAVLTQLADVRHALAALRDLPFVDAKRIAVGAWSVGALAAALAAASPAPGIAAFVSLDGAVGYEYGVDLSRALGFHASCFRSPFLHVTGAGISTFRVAKSRALFEQLTGPSAFWATLPVLTHGDFTSYYGMRSPAFSARADSTLVRAATDRLVRVIAAFLDDYLEGRPADWNGVVQREAVEQLRESGDVTCSKSTGTRGAFNEQEHRPRAVLADRSPGAPR